MNVRMSISVPEELKDEMAKVADEFNWSAVAAEAFRRVLKDGGHATFKEPADELREMLTVLRKFCDFTEGVGAGVGSKIILSKTDGIRQLLNSYERSRLGASMREARAQESAKNSQADVDESDSRS